MTGRPFRIGIGGPVGSGKTTLIERIVPMLLAAGRSVVVVTNDIVTREDELHVRHALAGILDGERIVGVETGACPHQAVREDPSMNLAVLGELEDRYPGTDYVLLESGGDNLTLTFSPELVDESLYVIDVAGGDKIPRKRGPGLIRCGLLVINKTDLAPYVGADLARMDADSALIRGAAPYLFTDARAGNGVDAVVAFFEEARAAWIGKGGAHGPREAVGSAAGRSDQPDRDHGHPHVHG
ncbi:MAG TPA: urease accessory protein UreG [Verrucomicrobiae bacterium]|nr:urease accessory protein UreG [Verrucomicrobiae bacterium]